MAQLMYHRYFTALISPFFVILFLIPVLTASAQRSTPAESAVTTKGIAKIKGQPIPYTATAGTLPVWNEEGKILASVFYVYYERSDIKDKRTRPLMISFNGGPGSASVWMHIGYTGPKFLNIDSEGFPIQPYGISDNPHSVLDVTDIVYIDPVNVGFSRILDPDTKREVFFGVNQDIAYLADWIETFVTRYNRWTSPKFLIGESYGTTRVAGLASRLQNSHWMYLNGVILVSPTGLGVERSGPVAKGLPLPYYAATAWYHKQLPPDLQSRDLDALLPEIENYTLNTYIPALTRGGSLPASDRQSMAEQLARYSGLSAQTWLDHSLAVPTSYFWKDLLREEGYTIGRLDSRYKGVDRQDAGQAYDFDPALTSWNHSFTPAINYYLREVLGYKTDQRYFIFGPVNPWDRTNDATGENLRLAMAQNPFMRLMVQSGYFDGGTDYFSAKFTMWNMDPAGRFQDRMQFRGYRSGHMMYLRQEDLATSNQHIREFIQGR